MLGACHTQQKKLVPYETSHSPCHRLYDNRATAQVYTDIGRFFAIKSKRQSLGLRPTTGLSAVACGLPRSSACTSNSTLSWEGEIGRPPERDRCPPGNFNRCPRSLRNSEIKPSHSHDQRSHCTRLANENHKLHLHAPIFLNCSL